MAKGINLITACVSYRQYVNILIDPDLSCSVLGEKCFANKGMIIPTYFCVSCSPDIPRVVMEIKQWTAGPQDTCSLLSPSPLI